MTNVQHTIYTYGLSETDVAERIAELLMLENPTVDTKLYKGGVSIIIKGSGFNAEDAEVVCKPCMDDALNRLGNFVCSVDETLQQYIVRVLREKHLKIALAESCTAGKLSATLTEVSGSSEVFECGVVSYSHEMKHSLLGVHTDLLEEKGAICPEVASEMAVGARVIGNSSFAVAITGNAGPGASDNQPVGTVYLALADTKRVWVRKIEEKNKSREEVREAAVYAALDMIRRYLEALPGMMAGSQPIVRHSAEKVIASAEVKKTTFWDKILIHRANGKADMIRRIAIWCLAALVLAGAVLTAITLLKTPAQNNELYQELEETFLSSNPVVNDIDLSQYPEGMLPQFYSLYQENQDIRGWITIDNTDISYPIMRNQSEYYKNHDFNKNDSTYGVPYFAPSVGLEKNDITYSCFTIFGNRTSDNQMFSQIPNYLDKDFLLEHQYISMSTLYETGRWQVCGVFYADSTNHNAEFDYTKSAFKNDEDYEKFLDALKNHSVYKFPVELTTADRLVLISVDFAEKEDFPNERVVLVAKLLDPSVEDKAFEDIEKNYYATNPAAFHGGIPSFSLSDNQNKTTTKN